MTEDNDLKRQEQEAENKYESNRKIMLDLVDSGKLPMPRKLTRGERLRLDTAKVNVFKIEPIDKRSFHAVRDDMVSWILDEIYPDFDFKELDDDICTFFGEYVFGLANRNDLAAKN